MSERIMFLIDNSPDEDGDQFRIDSIENYYYVMQYIANLTLKKIEERPKDTILVCFPLAEEL